MRNPQMSLAPFYQISVNTYPYTQETRKIVGNYTDEKVAEWVRREIIQNHKNLTPGIDVFKERQVENETHLKQKIFRESNPDFEEMRRICTFNLEPDSPRVMTRILACDLTDSYNPILAAERLTQALNSVNREAKKTDKLRGTLDFESPSKCRLSDQETTVEPKEPQSILLIQEGQSQIIGDVFLEAFPKVLKTSGQIEREIDTLITHFSKRP